MKVGITGHQQFDDLSVLPWIEETIREKLGSCSELCGLSSLAKGADQLFAGVLLELGGRLEAVLPFGDYEATFEKPEDLARFRELLARCSAVTTLEFAGSNEQSYFVAGQYVADNSQLLIAVWNGRPAAGLGGTGDIVSYARRVGKAVYQINPCSRTASDVA